jgi:ABC-type branched-subunit amino acid transport system ATPase component/ABC-type branched-subunit amino acid transport system permease subunit
MSASGTRVAGAAASGRVRAGLIAAGAVFFLALPFITDSTFYQGMLILSFLIAIGGVSWNMVSGWTGYVSLGHSAFVGIGGYTVAIAAMHIDVSPFVFVPLAGAVSGILALLVGTVLMRTRGHAFVILTIAFLFVMQLLVMNLPSITKGSSGVTLPLPQWDASYQYVPFYYALLIILALTMLTAWWMRRTKLGMGMLAIREDEDKAATVGVNTSVYKLIAFVVSAVFVGMAGGVYAYFLTFIEPRGMFDIVISVQFVLAALLGGRGTLWGPVLGAFMIEPLFEYTNLELGGGNWRLVLSGGVMALVVLFLPRGIIPSVSRYLRERRDKGTEAAVGARVKRREILVSEPLPPRDDAKPLLEVRDLQKRFGGVCAVDGASFVIPEGSISALIGPNGSGKTTAFNLIGGNMAADAGEIWFDGVRIDRLPPWQRAYAGMGRTFQSTRLFKELSVLENVVAPLRAFSWRQLTADAVSGPEAEAAMEALEFVGLERFADRPAGALSYGQQKLVELAQVLTLDPKLIMLDEPAGGINPSLIEQIADMIRELNRRGKTFLIVEHNMPLVLSLCDPVFVLARGACISSGTPAEIQSDPLVLDAYLGDDFSADRKAVAQ